MRKINLLPYLTGLLVAVLALGLPAAPAALADTSGTGTITLVAPGAALGQRVEVQWGDPLGGWHTVQGWAGNLDHLTPQGEAFSRWTVFAGNFGQKPFRWVVYNPDGKTLWAVGPWFALPIFNGQDVAQRLDHGAGVPGGAATPIPPTSATPTPSTPAAPTGGARVLTGHTFTYGVACFSGDCSGGTISALVGGLPNSTWIAVQWLDVGSQWRTVDGWQGTAVSVNPNGVLLAQWNFGHELLGRGPFRWALYTAQGGSLIGVSPSFNMPTTSRLNLYMTMAVN